MFTTISYDDKKSHLILHNHNNYGNHSVLAVGYQKYTYKSFFRNKDQIYIRIADGWEEHGIMFQ